MLTILSPDLPRTARLGQLLVSLIIALLAFGLATHVAYAASSGLDPDFGNGGIVTTTINGGGNLQALVVQPDGKIVAAGGYFREQAMQDFALARYNPDGTLDDSFGQGGVVTTSVSPFGATDMALDLALQEDGKVVAAGHMDRDLFTLPTFFAVVRYNTDGSRDRSFDEDGIATTGSPTEASATAYAVAIQQDAKIVAAGYMDYQVALVRYNTDGTLDESFGTGGIVTTTFAMSTGFATAESMLIQPDQKLVVAGSVLYDNTSSDDDNIMLARFHPDGTLDDSFGAGGLVTTPVVSGYYDKANEVALQTDGKIIVAGVADMGGTAESYALERQDIALIRYNSDGTLDPEFGNGGIVTTSVAPAEFDEATSLVVQADGKIVVAGKAELGGTGRDFVLLRYNTDGSLDASFGEAGLQTLAIAEGNGRDDAAAVVLYGEEQWIVGGSSGAFALARFDNVPDEPNPQDTRLYLPTLRQVAENRQQRLAR